jgi:hypothetical protein
MPYPTILSGAAGRALQTLRPLAKPTDPFRALKLLTGAKPDMVVALGAERARTIGKSMFEGSRTSKTAVGREQVRLGLDALQEVATQTARKRTIIGGATLGSAFAGYRVLTVDGS